MAPEKVRYRKVTTRMWNDGNFLALSAPKPSAQVLWFFLLTGPFSTPVPGVVVATLGGIADRLQWPAPATRRCWDEIAAREMATADWTRSLVWLPNALQHNKPESPNVAKSWRRYMDEHVPECLLRQAIERSILAELARIEKNPKAFVEAFRKDFTEAFQEGHQRSFPESGNREQVQEPPKPPSGEGGRLTRAERARAEADLAAFREREPRYVAPVHREPGRDYPEPRSCPHEPPCDDREVCLTLFAAARRSRVSDALQRARRTVAS